MAISSVGCIGVWVLKSFENPIRWLFDHDTSQTPVLLKQIISTQAPHNHLPSQNRVLADIFYVLMREFYRPLRGTETEDSQKLVIVKSMLEILHATPVTTLRTPSTARAFAMSALRMNNHLMRHFSTTDPSFPTLHESEPLGVAPRRVALENLDAKSLLVLGLAGLIEAFGEISKTGSVQARELDVAFQQLDEFIVLNGTTPALDSVLSDKFDIHQYTIETVSNHHLRDTAVRNRQSFIDEDPFVEFLRSVARRLPNKPWATDVVFKLLDGSTSGQLQDQCLEFVYYNSELAGAGASLMYNTLYELVRLAKREPSQFRSNFHIFIFHKITERIALGSRESSAEFETLTEPLLQRLIQDNLLSTLIRFTFSRHLYRFERTTWRGIDCGTTTQFWGEKVIRLAQKSDCQWETSDNKNCHTLVNTLRAFCIADSEPETGTEAATDESGDMNNGWGYASAGEVQAGLEDFMAILLHEMSK